MADLTGKETRTIAYWVDLYRCVDSEWVVDSFISRSEFQRDPRLLEGGAVIQTEGEYSLLQDDIIQRVRGAEYPLDTDGIYQLERDMRKFSENIAIPPDETFGIQCSSSSSSVSASSSSTSTSNSSSSARPSASTSFSSSSSSISLSSSSSQSESESLSSSSQSSSSVSTSLSSSSSQSLSSSSQSSSSISGVLLAVTANVNGTLSSDTPDPNGFPVDEVAEAVGWDDFDFVSTPGPLVAIIFDSAWPKKACLTSGVTTIEVDGTFGGLPASRVFTYSEFISDNVYGGRPTFVNPNPADSTCSDISQIAVFLEDC